MKKFALVHFNHFEKDGLVGWPDFRYIDWEPNYGDMLVCSALKRQIGASKDYVRIGFGDELQENVDFAVIRGSTYLHNEFNYEEAIRTLDSIDVPLTIVGLGAQNPVKDITFLDNNKNAEIFIKKLAEKAKSISVRGEFTAEIVKRLGAHNVRVTGCPSMFYTLRCPSVQVSELLASPQRRLGVSLHTGLMKDLFFCRAPLEARELHGQVINFCIRNASSVSLYEQGVELEFNIADKHLPYAQRVDAANQVIARLNAQKYLTPEDLIARMVTVFTIEEWLSKARDQDALIGFRFHGNMVGLLQGSPCLYYVYDSRLEEFCELYNLPWQDVSAPWKDPVKIMLDFDWSQTNNAIRKCYEEMKAFYHENGLHPAFEENQVNAVA